MIVSLGLRTVSRRSDEFWYRAPHSAYDELSPWQKILTDWRKQAFKFCDDAVRAYWGASL